MDGHTNIVMGALAETVDDFLNEGEKPGENRFMILVSPRTGIGTNSISNCSRKEMLAMLEDALVWAENQPIDDAAHPADANSPTNSSLNKEENPSGFVAPLGPVEACADCKYMRCHVTEDRGYLYCKHPSSVHWVTPKVSLHDLVYGIEKPYKALKDCDERRKDAADSCGPQGLEFEPSLKARALRFVCRILGITRDLDNVMGAKEPTP